MKLAILSESPADAAAVRILVDALLGEPTESISSALLSPPGWPAVLDVLPNVIKHLHYHTDADALAVVVDSDNSPVHNQAHDETDGAIDQCRVCLLRRAIKQAQIHLSPVAGRPSIKTAVGLAVPAIEAWYLCGIDLHVTEATLLQKLGAALREIKLQLKRDVYGTDRPSTARAVEEATRLAQNLDLIEQLFPNGFGTFARDVRNW